MQKLIVKTFFHVNHAQKHFLEKISLWIIEKLHYIIDHLSDYLDIIKEPLGLTSDQNVESMYQYVDSVFKASKYNRKNALTEDCREKQHKAILQINSYAVNVVE